MLGLYTTLGYIQGSPLFFEIPHLLPDSQVVEVAARLFAVSHKGANHQRFPVRGYGV